MIEFIEFTEDTTRNLNEVRKGLAGVKLVYAGHLDRIRDERIPVEDLMGFMRPYWYFGSIELYVTGQLIVYVKRAGQDVAIGFLRYTP